MKSSTIKIFSNMLFLQISNFATMSERIRKVKAFTLLEVLTSLSIVTLVILGPLTSAINSASYANQTKDVITATYLAEEALELLHYQYDSMYLQCSYSVEACDAGLSLEGSTIGEKSWRLFKTRLDDTSSGSVSCFTEEGCSYDFLDMMDATSTTAPPKYSPTGNKCSNLSLAYSTNGNGDLVNYYVCSGITASDYFNDLRFNDNVFNMKKTTYARKISIESKSTFEIVNPSSLPANLDLYHDDLLVTATVSFRRTNGVMRSIEVVDFIHAHP